ncbi:glutamine-hydrolyzing carbamoyl-phosphate synthase small subunit [Lujinxingia litoralis]|uniref:glutamine-hydrolyzing carbamoyl-phosphate synthase small subunit n=1 Tax=Lujinxingia litoralis TaxID=2211119 RepID=UPI00131467D4|nr:glutamine-hydrolyzing carbamoyl-phosphate synthase small subunit [Lujinxingia litoralis]
MSQSRPRLKSLSGRSPAILVFEDGSCFEGLSAGAGGSTLGEVVFNTSMSGYQEIATDPSYRGQIVTYTMPHMGNYGVNSVDDESVEFQAAGVVVRSLARLASNHRAEQSFEEWLVAHGVVGICEVDTRELTRKLRDGGVGLGIIVHDATREDAPAALKLLAAHPDYGSVDFVSEVATTRALHVSVDGDNAWEHPLRLTPLEQAMAPGEGTHVVVMDFGVKFSILRHLVARGIRVTLMPRDADLSAVEALDPDGVLWSNGPGDPDKMEPFIAQVRAISERFPTMGICLGHQLLAKAFGGQTFKLAFGHRGPNQPVQDQRDKTVAMTSQNHGYAVRREGFPDELEVTHVNLNDHTISGFAHRTLPIHAVQYHPEAGPGPNDATSFFDRFALAIDEHYAARA